MQNISQMEPFFEAMALNARVEEIMKDDTTNTVYANDGSWQSEVGSYIVQSLTINGEQCALPTFGVFTESRESLAELEATTLKMLSAASTHRYSEKDIHNQTDFAMMDSTSHNLEANESVCKEFEVENIPGTLICDIHLLMMLQEQIKELCQEIHDSLDEKRVGECFLVYMEFRNESLVKKPLKVFI